MKYDVSAFLESDRVCFVLRKHLREKMRGDAERMAERNEMDNEKKLPLVEETLSILLGAGFDPGARMLYARPSEENKHGKELKVQRVLLTPAAQLNGPPYIAEKVVGEKCIDMPIGDIVVPKFWMTQLRGQEADVCLTCQYRAEKTCFMCAHFDDERYCREACGTDKRMFETERHVCPECGKEWEE